MKDEQILRKAIEKAVENGFILLKPEWNLGISYEAIIFSHKFCRAFWGDSPLYCSACDRDHDTRSDCDAGFGYKDLTAWEFHLRNMVLEENPIKYLEKFIK